jgi:hypothetical protein
LAIQDPGLGPWAFQTKEIGSHPQMSALSGCDTAGQIIRSFTVGDILNELGVSRVDLVKMDVEGAEKEIFEHDCEWLDRIGAISVELHDRFKPGCSRAFYHRIDEYGFPILRVHGLTTFVAQLE